MRPSTRAGARFALSAPSAHWRPPPASGERWDGGDALSAFIDARDWPIVRLTMPEHVPDEASDARMDEMQALYGREDRFVLIMSGAELPRNSPRFMNAYMTWSRESFALQKRSCAGAVRIEADPERRHIYEKQAAALESAGRYPYPFRVAADEEAALRQAQIWLASPAAS